ncbi:MULTISPECIES: HD-GYP domain-containing protein [Pseudomonas]|uniref:Response regulator n=1 Tax=Pseudomonas gingeri TaxID=117681 RepID=A0A7Y7WPU5_9PSED|nr:MULTISPECIES: HD domain-containing phosphohydrolase [Pseudomonas]MPQ67317.1 response regulator [Pseudomonas sp. MWU12-2323]NWB85221.1 response regulator [Pseudomonas gingeri]
MFSKVNTESEIVIIDDVSLNHRLLESCLRAYGLRNIRTFSDSAEGLTWLQSNPWDLLLLDLYMPAPDGFEILDRLKQRSRTESPIIIVTALNDPQNRRKGLEMGANDFVCKPIDLPEVLLRVRSCLELAQATRLLREANVELERKVERRTAQLEASYQAIANSLGRAASYRGNDTLNHVRRIGDCAALLAKAVGMSRQWCELIRLAAPMHDVGNIGIEDAILRKPGVLTAREREIMQDHPRIGYEVLRDNNGSPVTDLAAEIALAHHERWDGTGYPNRLQSEAIPLSARITAICDVYEALRMPRPYREAWSAERSQEYLCEQAGRHFDPQLVDIFCGLLDEIEAERLRSL